MKVKTANRNHDSSPVRLLPTVSSKTVRLVYYCDHISDP